MHKSAADLSECSVGSMGDAGRMLQHGEEQYEGIGLLLLLSLS